MLLIYVIISNNIGGQLKEQEYQSKYFLAGFMTITGLIMFGSALFVMLYLTLVASIVDNLLVTLLIIGLIIGGYMHGRFKFERATKLSVRMFHYAQTIICLGIIVWSLCLVIVSVLSNFATSSLAGVVSLIVGNYIILSIVFSLLALFAIGFELREVDKRKYSLIYGLTVITVVVITSFVTGLENIGSRITLIEIVFSLLCTDYMLRAIINEPVGLEIEQVDDRYTFVVKALTYAVIAPIQIPINILNKLVLINNK